MEPSLFVTYLSIISFVFANLSFSSASASSVLFFAEIAFAINPFSPVSIAILTPASIKRTIIVITNAINVIPLFFFICLNSPLNIFNNIFILSFDNIFVNEFYITF